MISGKATSRINVQPDKIAIVILAAGRSTRFGQPKQLLEYRGKTLIRNAVESALRAGVRSVVAVTSPELKNALCEELAKFDVSIVVNEEWQNGMSTSIRIGLQRVMSSIPDLAAVVITLCDQPLVSHETLRKIIREYERTGKPIAASEYNDTVGVPALFDRSMFGELLGLTGDKGAKSLIVKHGSNVACVGVPEAAVDIDDPEDLRLICDDQGLAPESPTMPIEKDR